MKFRKSEALVLKSTPYREKDFIILILTEDFGKKTGMLYGAKSIRSPHRGLAEPFVRLQIQFTEKEDSDMVTVRSTDLVQSHQPLRKNYHAFLYACYFSELMLQCIISEHESHQYFDLLSNSFANLCDESKPYINKENKTYQVYFELRLLKMLGVLPQLESCVICSKLIWKKDKGNLSLIKSVPHFIDVIHGGVCCHQCTSQLREVIKLQPGTLYFLSKWINAQSNFKLGQIKPTYLNLIEIGEMTHSCLKYHLKKFPKSYFLLKES